MQKGTPLKSDLKLIERVVSTHMAQDPRRRLVKQAILKNLKSLGTSLTNFLGRLKYGDLDPAAIRDPNFRKIASLYKKGHWKVSKLLMNPNFYKAVATAKQTSLEGTDKWWLAVLAGVFEVRKPLMEGARELILPPAAEVAPQPSMQTLRNRRKRQRQRPSTRVRIGVARLPQ